MLNWGLTDADKTTASIRRLRSVVEENYTFRFENGDSPGFSKKQTQKKPGRPRFFFRSVLLLSRLS